LNLLFFNPLSYFKLIFQSEVNNLQLTSLKGAAMSTIKLFTLPAVFLLFTSALTLNSQWTFCPGSTNMTGLGTYPTVSVVNANTVYIAGGTSTAKVYRSIDGGSNFVNITGNLTGPELSGVCGVSDQIAMVCDGASPNAKIYRTTNGGVNWTMMVSTPTGVGFFNGIVRSILIPNFIYAMSDAPLGAGFFIAVSTNAGAIWKTTTPNAGSGSIATFGSLYCVDSLFYGFGHWTAPRYAYTTNAGTNWTVQTLTVLGLGGTAAFNSDKLKGIFATSYCLPQINFTTNGPGGLLSTMNIGGGGGEFPVLRFGGSSNFCFVAVGSGVNPIRMSTNSGDGGWSQMTTAGITGFSDMSFVDAGTELFVTQFRQVEVLLSSISLLFV
jgi:hypothetical protein